MKLLRYSDLEVQPWKNGAGIRRDLAHGRYKADDVDASWMMSLADISANADFSHYQGVTRWFLPITTGWITLNFQRDGIDFPVELHGESPPHKFSGEDKVNAVLHNGPIKALNLMTTDANANVDVQRITLTESQKITMPSDQHGGVSLMMVSSGVCSVTGDTWSGPVAKLNSLVNDSGKSELIEVSPYDWTEIIIATIQMPSITSKKRLVTI